MCLGAPALAVEPQFVVTMRFDGSENRVRTFYTGQTEVSSTTRTWQGGDNFSISLSARSAGGQRDDLAELEGTLTIVRIRWTGDAQTPPPEVTKFRVRWQQWSSLYVFSGEQAAFAHTHVEGITPEGTYEDRLYHGEQHTLCSLAEDHKTTLGVGTVFSRFTARSLHGTHWAGGRRERTSKHSSSRWTLMQPWLDRTATFTWSNVAIPTSARVMQNYGAYIPYNMPSLSDYSLRVQVTDNTDGFTDVAEKRMRVHFPIEKSHKYYPDYTGRLGNGKMIAVPVENLTDHQIRVTFIVSDTHRFTWSTQTKWRFDVEAKVKEVTFGGSYERTTTDEEQFELGRSVAVDVPVPSHHVAYCIVYPYGRREFWVVDHYGECGFLHQDAFRDDVRPERSGLFPWMLSIVIQHRDDLPPDMTVNAPDPSWP